MGTTTAVSDEHRSLLSAAAACTRDLDRHRGDEHGKPRVREMLTGAAQACRAVAKVFELDPTLADEPSCTGRFRGIDLLTELTRHFRSFLSLSLFSEYSRARPIAERWEEAEAIYQRIVFFGERLPTVIPRPDTDTEEGLRAVSRARLAACSSTMLDAAQSLRGALTEALRVSAPDPRALALDRIAGLIETTALELEAEHSAAAAAMSTALGLNRADS